MKQLSNKDRIIDMLDEKFKSMSFEERINNKAYQKFIATKMTVRLGFLNQMFYSSQYHQLTSKTGHFSTPIEDLNKPLTAS